jgi:tetratricopeptide (TPR) repeat protein
MNYPITEAKEIVLNEYFDKGKSYYENQHYLSALNIWEKILILGPKNIEIIKGYIVDARRLLADPYYERGWDYYKTKEYDKAIEEWEHVLALVPSYQGLESLLEKTRYKNIEVKIRTLLDNARKNYEKESYKKAYSLLNEVFSLMPKQEEASILFKKVVSKMKDNYGKFYDSGVSNFSRKEFAKSIELFNKALNYAITQKEESKCNSYIIKAKYELSKLDVDVPKEPVVAEVEQPKEEPAKIAQVVDQEEVRKHYTQGLYFYRNGYIEKAISEWEIVLSLDPENERAYTSLQRAKASLKK